MCVTHEPACGRHQRLSSGACSIVHYPNIIFQYSFRSILSWSFQRRHTCGCRIIGWAMINFYLLPLLFLSLLPAKEYMCHFIWFLHTILSLFFLLLFGLFLFFFFLLISFFNFISHYLVWFDLNFKVCPYSFDFCLFLLLF